MSKTFKFGPKTSQKLSEVGIRDLETLRSVGAVEAYVRLKAKYPQWITLNALWGMQAALMGVHWTEIPPDLKEALKRDLSARRDRQD